ncbi:NADH kinase [Malassezia vespertilionis]|uniref:Pos5p n=1 Tax=Malassezia vespertilionis TaxID=2020962 RepID=A0A2N1J8M6_9BASI|nr:NADH kinase [Malassezia vespertilionis]PKI82920.1 Pos5p [Malassezia vespertilionis]WFD08384.1 NADH kinase [Malassezia vespertilionis]
MFRRWRISAPCHLHTYVRNSSQLAALPAKAPFQLQPRNGASSLSGAVTSITAPRLAAHGGAHTFQWDAPPRNVLLVKKLNDANVTSSFDSVIRHLQGSYPQLNIVVDEHVWDQIKDRHEKIVPFRIGDRHMLGDKIDFVITLGGDGSILYVSSLFDQNAVPPVLSFSMGTLGFLLPYNIESFPAALKDVLESKFTLMLRMRMSVSLWGETPGECLSFAGEQYCRELHFMNELVLHRGNEPHMTTIDAYVNGEHLTQAIADGLIVSTPTGSTAYALSAGGPIIHPSAATMMLTPICPRSLSFRAVVFPSDSSIQMFVAPRSRSSAEVSVDGRAVHRLAPYQSAHVGMSSFPIPCIQFPPAESAMRRCGSASPVVADEWVHDINTLLKFNASFRPRIAARLTAHDAEEESYTSQARAILKHAHKRRGRRT